MCGQESDGDRGAVSSFPILCGVDVFIRCWLACFFSNRSVHMTIALVFRKLYPHCRILTSRSQSSDESEAKGNLQSDNRIKLVIKVFTPNRRHIPTNQVTYTRRQ